ncbi:MAG TPA: chorismate-binding protein, partial [Bacteroidota bacterium]
ERYSHVMHIVSNVSGTLRKGLSPIDALFACFPAGTLTGAPKIRAMEIIAECEPVRRGIYGGAIAYIDFSGNLDSCIAIRTIVVKNNTVYFQAGAGIVHDSVPEREYEETLEKLAANFQALDMAGE